MEYLVIDHKQFQVFLCGNGSPTGSLLLAGIYHCGLPTLDLL